MIDLRNVEKTYYSNAGDMPRFKENKSAYQRRRNIRYHRPQRCR